MVNITPYLKFKNQCRAAMEFYKECLGGELFLTTVGESPIAATMPAETHESILHADLKKDGVHLLFASDMSDPNTTAGNNVLITLYGDKQEVMDQFAKLAEGGTIVTPLRDEYFGLFGECKDKFGMNWFVQSDPEEVKA